MKQIFSLKASRVYLATGCIEGAELSGGTLLCGDVRKLSSRVSTRVYF